MSAINERMQAKETASRPAMGGWIEKGGKFSLTVTSQVGWRFKRTTRLTGYAERESGVTVVHVSVSTGVSRNQFYLILAALLAMAVLVAANGSFILGLLIAGFAIILYIPLTGDYNNSELLLKDLRRILSAKDRPPKK